MCFFPYILKTYKRSKEYGSLCGNALLLLCCVVAVLKIEINFHGANSLYSLLFYFMTEGPFPLWF